MTLPNLPFLVPHLHLRTKNFRLYPTFLSTCPITHVEYLAFCELLWPPDFFANAFKS
jgi:hypothetical protein